MSGDSGMHRPRGSMGRSNGTRGTDNATSS